MWYQCKMFSVLLMSSHKAVIVITCTVSSRIILYHAYYYYDKFYIHFGGSLECWINEWNFHNNCICLSLSLSSPIWRNFCNRNEVISTTIHCVKVHIWKCLIYISNPNADILFASLNHVTYLAWRASCNRHEIGLGWVNSDILHGFSFITISFVRVPLSCAVS